MLASLLNSLIGWVVFSVLTSQSAAAAASQTFCTHPSHHSNVQLPLLPYRNSVAVEVFGTNRKYLADIFCLYTYHINLMFVCYLVMTFPESDRNLSEGFHECIALWCFECLLEPETLQRTETPVNQPRIHAYATSVHTHNHHLLLLLSQKADTYLLSHRG